MPLISTLANASARGYGMLGGFAALGDYQAIMTATVDSGGASSITFSSIPSTFKHLQIRAMTKESGTGTGGPNMAMYFNSDSTYTNYNAHYLNATGSGSLSSGNVQASGYNAYFGNTVTSNASYANIYGAVVVDILDYASTAKNKTIRSLNGHDQNGSGEVTFNSAVWLSTSAINAITLSVVGSSFAPGNTFALYGIKG